MRAFAILATICAVASGTVSALVGPIRDPPRIDVKATGYDEFDRRCAYTTNACNPYNTRDGSTLANSRWSCKGENLDSSVHEEGCCITYCFEVPQDLESMSIAFHKGNENTRTLDVFDNGKHHSTITSNGKTLDYQYFNLYTDETEELKLCLHDPKWHTHVWLSITEVAFWML